MKTSSELYRNTNCPNHAEVSEASLRMVRARVLRKVAIDAIMQRGNLDIRGELLSRFAAADYHFEAFDQMYENLAVYERGIEELVEKFNAKREAGWRIQRIGKDEDTTVDYYGTPVKALCDFLMTNPATGAVHAVRVKSGKYSKSLKENSIPEAYVIAKYAHQVANAEAPAEFPVGEGFVDYAYFLDSKTGVAKANITENRFRVLEESMDRIHAAEDPTQLLQRCSGEDCGSCSMNIICNYEEPAMAEDVMRQVRSAGEITLSDEQQAVVDFREGVARVNAGPGAGKTLVVAFRVLELLRSGVPENKIALLTFTKAGAEEMAARINQYCQEANIQFYPSDMTIGTFNSFCMTKIEAYYDVLGYREQPRLLDAAEKYELCNRILSQFPKIGNWNYASYADSLKDQYVRSGFKVKSQAITEIIQAFDDLKGERTPTNVPAGAMNQVKAMFDRYQAELKARCLIEYDDQIVLMRKIGELVPDFYSSLGFEHIIVDEFQDTDKKQIDLLNCMINENTNFKSYMAVGDDSQAIFGFRHTTPEYMINFGTHFGQGEDRHFTDLNLLTCRRCPQPIISLANRINSLRTSRAANAPLVTSKQSDLQPVVQGFYTQKQEVKYICDCIEQDLAAGKNPSEIAVLTRNKYDYEPIAAELTRRGIPATLCNPVPYIKDPRVAAICQFWNSWRGVGTLGIVAYENAMHHGALKNADPEIIRETVENFQFPEDKGLSSFVEYARALDHIDNEGQFDATYRDFLTKIENCRTYEDLAEFFRCFDLYGYNDSYRREGKYEGVCITTVHSAKGLEWDTTYLTLSNFDDAKYHRNPERYINDGTIDEDYRLLFVGATRAKTKLVMTGLFELKSNSRDATLVYRNSFLEKIYELLDKPYAYQPRLAAQFKQMEQREAQAARGTVEVRQETAPTPSRGRGRGRRATQAEPAVAEGEQIAPVEAPTRPETADGLYTEQQMEDMNLTFDDLQRAIERFEQSIQLPGVGGMNV